MLEKPKIVIFHEVLRFNLESITGGVLFEPPDRRGETPRPNGPDPGQAAAAVILHGAGGRQNTFWGAPLWALSRGQPQGTPPSRKGKKGPPPFTK